MPWDERSAAAAWERAEQLPPLPGIASRRGADDAARGDDASTAAAAPAPPPLCVAPAGPVQQLRFDGSPAWAALVPAAAARLQGEQRGGGGAAAAAWPVARAPALYRGPRQLSCTYAFEWRCAGGTHRVRAPLMPHPAHTR